ncbi:GNAT family N-acetyltransferase [Salinibius halmophilus]|uniref:GNAT family N-acetyltransferase n=1 Tax=Salinibius halmophilus TaxID=1853216 RepID=UPI000E667820|nr:GNAT family N-acetyltransferase [Salinibius halmophilus]
MHFALLTEQDSQAIADYYQRNQTHFKPWSPKRSYDFYQLEQVNQRMAGILNAQAQQHEAHWLMWHNQQIIGHCTLSNIVRGPFQACYMGYGIDEAYQNHGLMQPFCQHVIDYAFNELGLHRIMANYMPHNTRSGALLERLGFVKEGLAKDYLKINGRWENHVLTVLTHR